MAELATPSPACAPPMPDETAVRGADDARETVRAIPSERLLLGRSCVTIDHLGTRYVLRATRAGKLILTK